jgi:hypothetical protein
MTSPRLPAPGDAARLARFLQDHQCWSIFWDKRHGVWRAAEDDPDSACTRKARTSAP